MPARTPPDPSQVTEIYIDESSQSGHRHLVLGGLRIKATEVASFKDIFERARNPELPFGELKWTKVSAKKLSAYRRIVDIAFGNGDLIHFHGLIVDTSLIDHSRYNHGDREVGFNKEIFQLAMKFASLYPSELFHLYLDERKTRQTPEDLRLILNRACRKNGDKRDWPFRRCQFRDSKTTQCLQLVDLLIGAIAWDANDHGANPNFSAAKNELSAYALGCAGVRGVLGGTEREGRFTIWMRRLRGASRGSRPIAQPSPSGEFPNHG